MQLKIDWKKHLFKTGLQYFKNGPYSLPSEKDVMTMFPITDGKHCPHLLLSSLAIICIHQACAAALVILLVSLAGVSMLNSYSSQSEPMNFQCNKLSHTHTLMLFDSSIRILFSWLKTLTEVLFQTQVLTFRTHACIQKRVVGKQSFQYTVQGSVSGNLWRVLHTN